MEIAEEIARRAEETEARIMAYLPREEGYQRTVTAAMNYSFQAGGKRLRPMLMWETYRMFGGKSDIIEPFMAAIEMIHTYSLIHDDLPAIDNDEYRRGRKTTHIVYGEAMAILAGDGLLNYAYETAIKALVREPGNPNVAKALMVLSEQAGIYGMVGGQTVDVETDASQEVSREQLDFIYRLKTGALIRASMLIGGILAGATKKEQEILSGAAERIGLAFQIRDDILDITGTTETLGKPAGSDAKNGKATYVTYEGIEQAEKDVEQYSREAVDLLSSLVVKNEFLLKWIEYLIHREK